MVTTGLWKTIFIVIVYVELNFYFYNKINHLFCHVFYRILQIFVVIIVAACYAIFKYWSEFWSSERP